MSMENWKLLGMGARRVFWRRWSWWVTNIGQKTVHCDRRKAIERMLRNAPNVKYRSDVIVGSRQWQSWLYIICQRSTQWKHHASALGWWDHCRRMYVRLFQWMENILVPPGKHHYSRMLKRYTRRLRGGIKILWDVRHTGWEADFHISFTQIILAINNIQTVRTGGKN